MYSSDTATVVQPGLAPWRPTADEVVAILNEMGPIVRSFADRDAFLSGFRAPSSGDA